MRAQPFQQKLHKKVENTTSEDSVTFEGSKGALKAAEILTRLGQDSKDVSISGTAIPTIFWGREPRRYFCNDW